MKNSTDMEHLRKHCKRMIDSCTNLEHLVNTRMYIKNAGLENDESLIAWFEFKLNLIGNINHKNQ